MNRTERRYYAKLIDYWILPKQVSKKSYRFSIVIAIGKITLIAKPIAILLALTIPNNRQIAFWDKSTYISCLPTRVMAPAIDPIAMLVSQFKGR